MRTVVFCLPGKVFSYRFLRSWTDLLASLPDLQITPIIRGTTGSNIYVVRNACLDGQLPGPINQKPFQGQLTYDYIMWLDSDMVFNPQDFKIIFSHLESHPKRHILSGLAYFPHVDTFTAIKNLKDSPYLAPPDVRGKKAPLKVISNGLFFMLIRFGVFEKLDYPWFNPLPVDLGPDKSPLMGEDIAFCLRAQKAGFPTYVHPQIIIGHEKLAIITSRPP